LNHHLLRQFSSGNIHNAFDQLWPCARININHHSSPTTPVMKPVHAFRLLTAPFAAFSLTTSIIFAGDSASEALPDATSLEESSESVLEALWDLPVVYSNKQNPVLQEFRILGRYQGQYAVVDSDQGEMAKGD
jgi:hypothetical protein